MLAGIPLTTIISFIWNLLICKNQQTTNLHNISIYWFLYEVNLVVNELTIEINKEITNQLI